MIGNMMNHLNKSKIVQALLDHEATGQSVRGHMYSWEHAAGGDFHQRRYGRQM